MSLKSYGRLLMTGSGTKIRIHMYRDSSAIRKGSTVFSRKVGEESTEFIIAVKNGDHSRTVSEAADLQFHLMVALRAAVLNLKRYAMSLRPEGVKPCPVDKILLMSIRRGRSCDGCDEDSTTPWSTKTSAFVLMLIAIPSLGRQSRQVYGRRIQGSSVHNKSRLQENRYTAFLN